MGNCLTASSVGRRINRFGKVLGLSAIITPTMLRKALSTYVVGSGEADQEKHASFLEHNLSTERKFYQRVNKRQMQKRASVQNQKMLGLTTLLKFPKKSGRPSLWNDDQQKALENSFQENIKKGVMPSSDELQKAMEHKVLPRCLLGAAAEPTEVHSTWQQTRTT